MTAVVKYISKGRWSIHAPDGAHKMAPSGPIPGYSNEAWPQGIVVWVKHFLWTHDYPAPKQIRFYSAETIPTNDMNLRHDWIEVIFPDGFRFHDTSRRRRKGLEAVAEFFTAEDPKWTTLGFGSGEDMAKFINEIDEGHGITRDHLRVGVDTVNVASWMYEAVKSELGPDRFNYRVYNT